MLTSVNAGRLLVVSDGLSLSGDLGSASGTHYRLQCWLVTPTSNSSSLVVEGSFWYLKRDEAALLLSTRAGSGSVSGLAPVYISSSELSVSGGPRNPKSIDMSCLLRLFRDLFLL